MRGTELLEKMELIDPAWLEAADAAPVRKAGKHYRVTISIGCCRKVPDSTSMASIQSEAEQFLRSADQAMYLEKKSNS